jgi:membrane-associated phospholipid phosphatase
MDSNIRTFRPEDTALLTYLAGISVFVTLFNKGVDAWWVYVLSHSVAICIIIFWLRYARGRQGKVIHFFRHWYIVILYTVFYEQIDAFILGLHGRYLDHLVYNFEKAVFGIHPSVWLERLASPVLTEIMSIAYHSYYWLIPLLGFSLYLRKEFAAFRQMVFTVSIAFFVSYFGFILFPVEGPRYALGNLYQGPLDGYLVTRIQNLIMEYGDIRGGCMPSSHVAVALAVLLLAWTYRRRMAIYLTPVVTLLCISTVYKRYHYVSDVIGGLVVGVLAFWWGKVIYKEPSSLDDSE